MAYPRILVVYKSGRGPISLGDRIRTEEILAFLQRNQFRVIKALLPSLTRWEFWRAVPSLFPLHRNVISVFSHRGILPLLDMSASINNLEMIIRKTTPNVVLAEGSLIGWMATLVC